MTRAWATILRSLSSALAWLRPGRAGERDLELGPADLEAFARSGLGSLTEFLKLPIEVRAALMRENEAVRDREARTLALYVAGALAGAHEEVAATVDPGASEEAANLAALNAALSGAGQGGGL